MPLELKNADSEQFLTKVKESGAIQLQLISSSESKMKLSFDWTFNKTDWNEIGFKLEYEQPSQISSTSYARDSIRIIFVETFPFLSCSKGEAGLRRRLQSFEGRVIPAFTEAFVFIPP